MKATASDADDPTYGSSARVVYSVLDGEKIFTVDKHTGQNDRPNIPYNCYSIFFSSQEVLLCLFYLFIFLLYKAMRNLKLRNPISHNKAKFVAIENQKINQEFYNNCYVFLANT